MQMVDLPADGEGLSWIVDQDPTQLLLIPGLQPAYIAAAAAGNQQALAYLHSTAQQHAADPFVGALSPLERACLQASKVVYDEDGYHQLCTDLHHKDPQVAAMLGALEYSTRDKLVCAASAGQLAALQWMQAICAQTFITDCDLATPAAVAGHINILKHLRTGGDPPYLDY